MMPALHNPLMMKLNKRRQVLVVEDDCTDSFLLRHQLAKAQFKDHVIFVENGKEALEFLLQAPFPPIAILLDLHLPGLSGVELLQRVRQDSRLMAIPVIVMTGFNDPHDMKKCHELGITAYLPKPINLSIFIKTVADLFQEVAAPDHVKA